MKTTSSATSVAGPVTVPVVIVTVPVADVIIEPTLAAPWK